ncbi:DoxX family protein [Hymenobacter sp. BT491]|uniref:DoxX family protein n=1 Tax=Hymenobacter sp. BT491 TaxID=2766779 RepID=UPI001653DF1D|nr:DoxX family protein [Hymenobacter sp. BT491]MBC6992342.1 DoxX family protein [Hymenobacter sp. BT491]
MNASTYTSYAYALLRLVAGLLFALHGSQKLLGFPGDGHPVPLGSLMGVAGIIELVGGLLIMVGLFARPAAFLASGEMAVAYFMAHFPQSPWPAVNHGEPAILFCFLFLLIAAAGAGVWSLDGLRNRRLPGTAVAA